MEEDKIYSKLTAEDVELINEIKPDYIKITDTKSIDPELLDRLDPEIKIIVVGNDDHTKQRIPEYEYELEEFREILSELAELERGLKFNPSWTDYDRAIYLYSKLIYFYSLRGFDKAVKQDDSLKALLTHSPNSRAMSLIYQELCVRNGIPSRYIENNDHTSVFNEVKIGDNYYPVDVFLDYQTSSKEPGSLFIHNFGKNPEFYFMPEHKTDRETEKYETLNPEEVQKSLDKVSKQIAEDYTEKLGIKKEEIPEPVIRPDITLKSKELEGIFEKNEVTEETSKSVDTLEIKLTDDNTNDLASDLKTIGQFYPELLNKIKIENVSGKQLDLQKSIDSVYEAKYPGVYDKTLSPEEASKRTVDKPLDLEVVITSQDDLDSIDLTHAPKYVPNGNEPEDVKNALYENDNKITLNNTRSTPSIITDVRTKVPADCECFILTGNGWDLSNTDFASTRISYFDVSGQLTRNIDGVRNIGNIVAFGVNNVPDAELNKALNTFNRVLSFSIRNQNLHNRDILNELKRNPNIGMIKIYSSRMNNLDGLEDLDGRLAWLALISNDLNTNDAERLYSFKSRNDKLTTFYLNNNSGIDSEIDTSTELSDESFNFIKKINHDSGYYVTNNITTKKEALNYLMWNRQYLPVYIKDAKLLRQELKIMSNPFMLNNDNDINTVNFNEPYLRDATLLLTIPQARLLISSGRRIPQNINLKIESVKDLSVIEAEELKNLMTTNGLHLTGIQIFDAHNQNIDNTYNPYKIDDYIEIRRKLDMLVSGIDPSEPDIDKFAVIYQRFKDSMEYDFDAIDETIKTHDEIMVYGERMDNCRNMLNGLRNGKCVCSGYADLLRNALALVDIDARFNQGPGHAWNQVAIKDEYGNTHWYNTDATWDRNDHANTCRWTLLSDNNFIQPRGTNAHKRHTPNTELADRDYDRVKLKEALDRAQSRSFDLRTAEAPIAIPANPNIPVGIPNSAQIKAEFDQRKNDMYAKYYGDRDYRREYRIRNTRFKGHRVQRNDGTYDYETIEDYPEREEDEKFLLLDKYKTCLERMTRYQNGDTSVYTGTPDQVARALEKDREYIDTNNHTFNQNRTTREDLMTLGKYGERVPYMPRQNGVLRNVARGIVNIGIFGRNLVAPVYRFLGRYVAVPIHRLIYGNSDPSPFRNNFYHRVVARRDYFTDYNNRTNPGHPIINAIKARGQAVFQAKKGNEAVLRAGAADIRRNTEAQLRQQLTISNLAQQSAELTSQINFLNGEISAHPRATNIADAVNALNEKIARKQRIDNRLGQLQADIIGIEQTDAISDKQHAIASKEVNTFKVTVIKGVAKVAVAKYVGPKIYEWLVEKGKITKPVEKTVQVPQESQRWVDTTYRYEPEPIYETQFESATSLSNMMAGNKGKQVTGFYSVWGGERRPDTYTLTGNEEITAIFHGYGGGGHGLSDTVGLKAPVLTDGTFTSEMLNGAGKLSQNISLKDLVQAVKSGEVDPAALEDLYVSVSDMYWTRLSDLTDGLTKSVQVGTKLNKVVDVPGHMEKFTDMVDKVIQTTEVVRNPAFEKAADITMDVGKGVMITDTIYDINENLRKTTTDKRSNKTEPRDYTFDEDLDEIPTSGRAYKKSKDER